MFLFLWIVILSSAVFGFFAYWIFNFIILYHLARFGIGTAPKKSALIFLVGAIILFFLSVMAFVNISFVELFDSF